MCRSKENRNMEQKYLEIELLILIIEEMIEFLNLTL